MKIHDRRFFVNHGKLSKTVIIYAFHQTPIRSVQWERILFTRKFSCENVTKLLLQTLDGAVRHRHFHTERFFFVSFQAVSITVESRASCKSRGVAPLWEFCAGGMLNGIPQDACGGDSGGAVECANIDGEKKVLISKNFARIFQNLGS